MSLPKLLLVSGVTPGRGNVGREYLRIACGLLPRDRVVVFSFDPAGEGSLDAELSGLKVHYETDPQVRDALPGERRWAVIRHLVERRVERVVIPPLIERIVAFGRREAVDRVWVPLHTPTTIRVALAVASRLELPMITTVWDTPSYKMKQFGLGRRMRRALLKTFDSTNRYAESCGTASDPMRDLYARLYGTRAVTMILGAPRPERLESPADDGGPFRIGFAGTLYADTEFAAFRSALDRLGWAIHGRAVQLEMFGDHERLAADCPQRIRSHGWQDPAETVRGLSACHAAYLPYWFARRRREVVEVSFPGKLALYAAARTPVLFHGPSYASPVKFLERFRMGRVCATLNPAAIATALEAIVEETGWRERASAACDRAYSEELSAAVFRDRFAQLLAVEPHELLAVGGARC